MRSHSLVLVDPPVAAHLIERDEKMAKFWLEPVRLQRSSGFSRVDIRQMQTIIDEHQEQLREAWHEYFRNA